MTHINRRQFLTIFASTLGATTLSSCMPNGGMGGSMLEPSSGLDPAKLTPVAEIPAVTVSSNTASSFNPDVEIVLRSFVDDYIFSDGDQTNMLRYAGELLTGQPENLTPMADSYLGPTIRLKKGQKVRIHLQNQLPFPTIAHWHGQHLPEEMDGHPLYSIESGETYVYEFEVNNRAGTYWYHPHPHGHTGAQVYFGLAGLFIIEDEEEQAYDLPRGEFDVPVVIQDRTFKDDGELQYIDNGHQVMAGFWANSLMINGRRDFLQKVSTQPYRIRLLNGSNARIYKLAWDDDTPVTVIGTDGGLLGAPVTREYVMLAPAERLELWVDFAGLDNGSKKSILALPFTGGNESVIELVRFEVDQQTQSDLKLPAAFAPLKFLDPALAVNHTSPRQFDFFVNHMTPTIGGRGFEIDKADPSETVKLNDLEIWELTNDINGASGFPHPIHVHGVQFQVLERTIDPESKSMWDSIKDGYVDDGWKDTVLLMPGERAKILLKFEDYTGLFLYHCHNLEHEDGGMMRNYRVEI